MRGHLAALLGLSASVMCGAAIAETVLPAEPQALIEYREGQMKEMGGAIKRAGDAATAAEDAKAAAAKALAIAAAMETFFPETTAPGAAGVEKTRALANIWSDAAGFAAAREKLLIAVDSLNAAVNAGDAAGIAAAKDESIAACKSCHETFRGPED